MIKSRVSHSENVWISLYGLKKNGLFYVRDVTKDSVDLDASNATSFTSTSPNSLPKSVTSRTAQHELTMVHGHSTCYQEIRYTTVNLRNERACNELKNGVNFQFQIFCSETGSSCMREWQRHRYQTFYICRFLFNKLSKVLKTDKTATNEFFALLQTMQHTQFIFIPNE